VLGCVVSGNYDGTMQTLAWVYVGCRVLFILFYLLDYALLRSIVWSVGVISVFSMIVRAALSV